MKISPPTIGETYGRLTITKILGRFQNGTTKKNLVWKVICTCRCGNTLEVLYSSLKNSNTRSCGCLQRDRVSRSSWRHGAHSLRTDTTTQALGKIWHGLRKRNRYDSHYAHVTVCDEWMNNFDSFKQWALSHGYREGLTIDRRDNAGGYEPSNCRWATASQQARNRSTNRIISWLGEEKCLGEWIEDPRCPLPNRRIFYQRTDRGWTPTEAISTPPLRRF